MIREAWLQPAADGPVCGPNLDYDPEYLELETVGQGKPERRYGDSPESVKVIPAEEPDWADVVKRASALLDRSRDVRIVRWLTRGLTRTEGLGGLREGLDLLHRLLATFWEELHPQLTFEGDPDPILRLNALTAFGDVEGLVRDVRLAVFLRSPLGTFTLRDVAQILGVEAAAETASSAVATDEQLRAVVRDAVAADAGALGDVVESVALIDRIRKLLLEHVDPGDAPDFAALRALLRPAAGLVEAARAAVGAGSAGSAGRDAGTGAATALGAEAGLAGLTTGAAQTSAVGSGEIRSRDDAVRALDRVCDYLARSEPTNPAPLLIRRAQRVMTMNFLDIIRDLAPDAIGEVERLAGNREQGAGNG